MRVKPFGLLIASMFIAMACSSHGLDQDEVYLPKEDIKFISLVQKKMDEIPTTTTTHPPSTTTTQAPTTTTIPPTTTTAPPETTTSVHVSTASDWDRLAQCESGGNWSINTGNGYYGGLQFDKSTWLNNGGGQYAPYPHQTSRENQIKVGEVLRAKRGWYPWPACSRKFGWI